MPKYYLKPLLWNTNNYAGASGVRASSGFPKKHGYGHEEWNNLPQLTYRAGAECVRVFHAEGLRNTPVDELAGNIFLFMYASHDSVHQLVGIAGQATAMHADADRPERTRLARRLGFEKLGRTAWEEVPLVRRRHRSKHHFDTVWARDLHWIPNWKCPSALYFQPRDTVLLDPERLTGKTKLLTMFRGYTEISATTASRVMNSVPRALRDDAWSRLDECLSEAGDDIESDLGEIASDEDIGETTRKRLVDARLGQGRFRRELEVRWGGGCAVTGCRLTEVLRASHIRPWRESTHRERLDPANGLLLSANLDALFDRGLITFTESGRMRISAAISGPERRRLALAGNLRRRLSSEEKGYLDYHAKHRFIA